MKEKRLAVSAETPMPSTGRIGFLLFLGTEAMLFAGLLSAYFVARITLGSSWPAPSTPIPSSGYALMKPALGLVNTILLVTANMCVSYGAARLAANASRAAGRLFTAAIFFGLLFLGVKLYEYHGKIEHHLLPATAETVFQHGRVWSSYYFGLTGLHALHIVVGLLLLIWLSVRSAFSQLGPRQVVLAQNVSSYWVLVDAIWLILFPMLYLL